jgi:hypothetical protein
MFPPAQMRKKKPLYVGTQPGEESSRNSTKSSENVGLVASTKFINVAWLSGDRRQRASYRRPLERESTKISGMYVYTYHLYWRNA